MQGVLLVWLVDSRAAVQLLPACIDAEAHAEATYSKIISETNVLYYFEH